VVPRRGPQLWYNMVPSCLVWGVSPCREKGGRSCGITWCMAPFESIHCIAYRDHDNNEWYWGGRGGWHPEWWGPL
jgi:hypothetical protein